MKKKTIRICFNCGKEIETDYYDDSPLVAFSNMRSAHPVCFECFQPGFRFINSPPYTIHWEYREPKEGEL